MRLTLLQKLVSDLLDEARHDGDTRGTDRDCAKKGILKTLTGCTRSS